MTGQRGPRGGPVKKPTGIVASNPRLLKPLRQFVCDKWHGGLGPDHEHPTGADLAKLQVWTHKFARAIADGIQELIEIQYRGRTVGAYPETGVQHGEEVPSERSASRATVRCVACRRHWIRTHPAHTRERGDCWHPDVVPIEYPCKGCQLHRPVTHTSHTYVPSACRAATGQRHRQEGTTRRGRHP